MQYSFFCIIKLYTILLINTSSTEKIQYISTEHPAVTYWNPKYVTFVNLTAQRYRRGDPFYYVGLHLETLHYWDNNVSVDIFFYEWLTNQYKRGFVEMHFKLCDLVHTDKFFGTGLKQGGFAEPCPYPPAEYHLYNMTIPVKYIPANFPFRKGRIYANVSSNDANELMGAGHIDMEIKYFNTARKRKN